MSKKEMKNKTYTMRDTNNFKDWRKEFEGEELVNIILDLWKEYKTSTEGQQANVPDKMPVFNATNFIYWLIDKHEENEI